MSFEAIAAVMNADIRPPSLKLAAVAMANFLNKSSGQLNPSMTAIARACGLSEVQARRLVHELIDMNLLTVVGNQRGGGRGTSRHYRLHLDQLACIPRAGERANPLAGETLTPLTGESPISFDRRSSHERALSLSPAIAPPLASDSQIREEPRKNQELNQEPRGRAVSSHRPADVSEQTWADWTVHLRGKRLPVTAAVLDTARKESEKAGVPLEEFLEIWCFRGARYLKAEWL